MSGDLASGVGRAAETTDADGRPATRLGHWIERTVIVAGIPFFLVACAFSYYGQLHRAQSGDTYGTVYTAVALVDSRTIWLDRYLPYIQQRSGEQPYMLRTTSDGHSVNATPLASSLLAVPLAAAARLAGTTADEWGTWLEVGFLSAALTAAAAVAVLFALLTRLTTHRRAVLLAATFAWGTMSWAINGQALWQHAGATLALCVALLALVDRRFGLAGAAVGAMIAFRFSTPVLALFLLPLLGRSPRHWLRFALGALPLLVGLGVYNYAVFGSVIEQGYGTAHVTSAIGLPLAAGLVAAAGFLAARRLLPRRMLVPVLAGALLVAIAAALVITDVDVGRVVEGLGGLLVSPGRGLLVYSPVLAFAVLGAVRGWQEPLYRWSALGAGAYMVVMANSPQWHGGEGFGPRRLAEAVPLLILLLVPALDPVLRTGWRWLFFATLAWSVLVQLLAAATWSSDDWFDGHDTTDPAIWWRVTDNELVAMLSDDQLVPRVAAMAGILVASIALGLVAARLWRSFRPIRT